MSAFHQPYALWNLIAISGGDVRQLQAPVRSHLLKQSRALTVRLLSEHLDRVTAPVSKTSGPAIFPMRFDLSMCHEEWRALASLVKESLCSRIGRDLIGQLMRLRKLFRSHVTSVLK
jgi:hypothetical protein